MLMICLSPQKRDSSRASLEPAVAAHFGPAVTYPPRIPQPPSQRFQAQLQRGAEGELQGLQGVLRQAGGTQGFGTAGVGRCSWRERTPDAVSKVRERLSREATRLPAALR